MATRFQSAWFRTLWSGLIVRIALDVAAAGLLVHLLGDSYQPVTNTLLLVGAVYAVRAAYGTWVLISQFAVFFLYDKESRIASVLSDMRHFRMPRPESFYGDSTEYFTSVAMNSSASSDARLFAGACVGGLETMRTLSLFFPSISTAIVLEAAIERYAASLPADEDFDRAFQRNFSISLTDD